MAAAAVLAGLIHEEEEESKDEPSSESRLLPRQYMADKDCGRCYGTGIVERRICHCAYRKIFDSCMEAYARFVEQLEFSLHRTTGTFRKIDYISDVTLIARRNLTSQQFAFFRRRWILGEERGRTCIVTGVNRDRYFYVAYRIKQVLGQAFAETKPYGVYPLGTYLNPPMKGRPIK